jgi:hypothetical protein
VAVGWVVRLGHVSGWMFMFGVVAGGEPHSWVLAQHHLDQPYSIFYVGSCWVVLRTLGRAGKHECEQGTWPLGGQGFLVVGGCVVQASSRRMGSRSLLLLDFLNSSKTPRTTTY